MFDSTWQLNLNSMTWMRLSGAELPKPVYFHSSAVNEVSKQVHPDVQSGCPRNLFCSLYVCIEVALRGDALGIGRSNWAKGRDPSGSWVQYPNPAVPTHAGSYLRTNVRFLSQLYFRQLRVSCVLM